MFLMLRKGNRHKRARAYDSTARRPKPIKTKPWCPGTRDALLGGGRRESQGDISHASQDKSYFRWEEVQREEGPVPTMFCDLT